jgi:hypothetical protein
MEFLFYWLDDKGVVQTTEDPNVAEKALHEYKQIWGSNKGELELGLLLMGRENGRNRQV